MTVRPIIIGPDPILKQVSEPVLEVNDEIRQLVDDMIDTMRAAPGSGLAAIQIGVPKRVLVLDISSYVPENTKLHILINPIITYNSDDNWVAAEGCLSFPGIERTEVKRPQSIKVSYLDYDGKQCELEADDWFARGIQHEMDHLNGVVLLDYVPSKLKLDICIRKLKKYKKSRAEML